MSATAVVTVTLRVTLSQPWSNEERVGQVIRGASLEAKQTVSNLIKDRDGVDMTEPVTVRVIYQEDK